MGIAKIQSADNVFAIIPNSQARDLGRLRMKFLKTRDSAGVGSYVDFKTEWNPLSFVPVTDEEGGGAANWKANATSNNSISNEEKFKKMNQSKPDLRRSNKNKDKETDDDSSSDKEKPKAGGTAAALRKTGINKKKPLGKKVKLV